MEEITDIAWFARTLQDHKIRLAENEQGRGYTPFSALEYNCPCGDRHELKKNKHGFLVQPGLLVHVNDPEFIAVRPELFLDSEHVLMSCSELNGLGLVSVDKKLFKQSATATHFIRYTTLNRANKGFGLIVETPDANLDFNLIGQSRQDYPTEEFSDQHGMENALMREPEEHIIPARRYIANLSEEVFKCPCGSSHRMGGVREDFSLFQLGKQVTLPVLVVLNDLSKRTWKSVLYRCPERYTMISWRPSKRALWSAKIEMISHRDTATSILPKTVFEILSGCTQTVEIERFLKNENRHS